MNSRWPNRSSIWACGTPGNAVRSIILMIASPMIAVNTVARMTRAANLLKATTLLKYVSRQLRQK